MRMIKKTPFFYLLIFFVFLNIVDLVTTVFILPSESNPIYLLTHSYLSILLIKIVVVAAIIWLFVKNQYNNKVTFYLFVCTIVYGTLALGIAQAVNIYAILHPALIVQGAQVTTQDKVTSYNSFMLVIYLIPILLSLICFWIYNKSVDYIKIVKKKKK